MNDRRDASSPFIWPPAIYGGAALVAAALTWLAPLDILTPAEALPWRLAGVAVFAVGVGVALLAGRRFKAVGTPIKPTEPTTALVEEGIYRYTRNPMYLGMTLMLLGLAAGLRSAWFLIALPIAVLAVTKLAIEREERYLETKFGEAYRAYKSRVRRWL